MLYIELTEGATLQAGFSVSSRNFKKAVQRNRIKRLLREGYRLEKGPLEQQLTESHKKLAVFILYIGREMPVLTEIQEKMRLLITKLVKQMNELAS